MSSRFSSILLDSVSKQGMKDYRTGKIQWTLFHTYLLNNSIDDLITLDTRRLLHLTQILSDIEILYQGLSLNWIYWISLSRTLPQVDHFILSHPADIHTLWTHPVWSHTLTPNGNLARWKTFFIYFSFLSFLSFLLRQFLCVNCAVLWVLKKRIN